MNVMNETIRKYTDGEITLEETNAVLEKQGIALVNLTAEERAAKEARENAEGFLPGDKQSHPLPRQVDLSRRKDLSNQTVIQHIVGGYFAVEYDEKGYAVKSRRVYMA